jgi:Hydrazine synthase alpha subunit middle domain/WD40-like Beta Propeller Repeat
MKTMKNIRRDLGHALPKIAALLLPLLIAAGCSSGVSGHAPGLAGEQAQDPGTLNFPLAYIKRPPPKKEIDVRDLITSTTGGDVFIRAQASAGSPETNITGDITKGMGDVRDLDVSADGKKLVFSLRLPLNPNKKNTDKTQPTWKIYSYDAEAKVVTQLTNDNTTAGHDVAPHFLPDGRIVFSSSRQAATQAILIDEGRPQYPAQTDMDPTQPIFLLHVMNADGSGIHQISFNTDHDFAPSVMANGQVVFSRSDTQNGGQISLYRTNPDGTGLELFYGENSHKSGKNLAGTNNNPIQFLNARQRADGKLVAIVRPFIGTLGGGDIVQIDAANWVETTQSASTTPASGTAQVSATTLAVTTDANMPSFGGWFSSVYPLLDGTNRMLVSWAPCLVLDNSVTPASTQICNSTNTAGIMPPSTDPDAPAQTSQITLAPPQYTIWIYDLDKGTLSPILGAEAGSTTVEPVIMQARTPAPTFIADATPTGAAADLAQNSGGALGLLVIRSVYDFDGVDTVSTQTGSTIPNIAALANPAQATANQRPARFLRVQKAVEIPDEKVRKISQSAFGPTGMMREILAYVPIEPDGSVKVELPANVPFTIDVLDKNARRISRPHTNWLQLMPGETKTCNGCHTAGNTTAPSHGRSGLTASAWAGAASAGTSFPNTVAALSVGNVGDTMADTLALNTCRTGSMTPCSQVPSIDVLYADVWTDQVAAGRAPDAAFSYLYADLSTPKPQNANCGTWGALCRSTIHYPLDNGAGIKGVIQAIWSFPRDQTFASDGTTVLSEHTCTSCHTPTSAAAAFQVPAGQLDLTTTAFSQDQTITISYADLLMQHNEQALNMGILQDVLVPVPGSTTGETQPVPLPAVMAAGSATGSEAGFFSKFDGTDHGVTTNHTGWLTPAELRLISEWLDIGAQYYNDPFVAPTAN